MIVTIGGLTQSRRGMVKKPRENGELLPALFVCKCKLIG
jgi:hypothetical protein